MRALACTSRPLLGLWLLCAGLLALEHALGSAAAQSEALSAPFFRSGQPMPAFRGRSEGRTFDWSAAPGKLSLLLVFAPGCAGCESIAPRWLELLQALQGPDANQVLDEVLFVGVGPEEASRAFLTAFGLEGTLVAVDLAQTHESGDEAYGRFLTTPQTVLVDRRGQARRVVVGGWHEGQEHGLDAWLHAVHWAATEEFAAEEEPR